jgi:hypothetical protein
MPVAAMTAMTSLSREKAPTWKMETLMSENIREVVGTFHDAGALESAAEALMSNGFDRAHLSLIATEAAVKEKFSSRVTRVEQLQDDPATPRIAYVNRDDLAIGKAALIGGLFYVGSVVATGAVLMSGGALLPALAAAAAGGLGAGGLGTVLASILQSETADKISAEVERGGLILWVRAHQGNDDDLAMQIMRDHGAYDVHAHGNR